MCDGTEPSARTIPRPRWALLHAIVLSPLAALAIVELTAPANPLRMLLRGLFTVGIFAGMAGWLRCNRPAFDLQSWCACAPGTITIRVIESPRAAPSPAPREPAPGRHDEERELVLR
jgi:hypothetical protein